MTKLSKISKRRKHSRGREDRFYTSRDMSILKHDEAVQNAKRKRGELPPSAYEYIAVCGCGVEGCFIHSGTDQNYGNKVKS